MVENSDLSIGRAQRGQAGTTSAALAFGGGASTQITNATEEWSDTSNTTKTISTD